MCKRKIVSNCLFFTLCSVIDVSFLGISCKEITELLTILFDLSRKCFVVCFSNFEGLVAIILEYCVITSLKVDT